MTAVLITIDAEISSPFRPNCLDTKLDWELERDIWGRTRQGDFGLPYQLEVLNSYGLKATVFTEALFASAAGAEPLSRIVRLIRDLGHDVQLHVHTEWLARMRRQSLAASTPDCIGELPGLEQRAVLREAIENLVRCGAAPPCAFRAGNFGADNRTLRELARAGLRFDTSYNRAYLDNGCRIAACGAVQGPRELEGVLEFPVACFEDWPGHHRHAQVCACSAGEMRHLLLSAYRAGWPCCVLLSHGFELLKRARRPDEYPRPNWLVIRRFHALCRFLAAHRDRFPTLTFSDPALPGFAGSQTRPDLRSCPVRTAWRFAGQAAGKYLGAAFACRVPESPQ